MRGEISRQANIGPYRLLSPLGGGNGSVHRAAGPDGRDVAIRLLPPGAAPDIERMRKVLSPYAVDVLDGEAAGPHPYVVSRFVPGRPLAETVAERGPMSGDALRLMATGLAKALAAIHEAGLVHGALDPGGVLVVDDAPVVVDFALTGVSDTGASDAGASDAGASGAAADIAAWAATVTFAATGDPDAPSGALPEALRPLVEAAADPDPAARPTAADLASAASGLDLPAAEPMDLAPADEDAGKGAGKGADEDVGKDTGGDAPGTGAEPSAPDVDPAAGSGGGSAATAPLAELPEAPGEAIGTPVAGARAHEMAVALGWARLLTAMVMVIAVCVVVMAPVAGLVLSLGAVTLLRAAGTSVRGWARAFGRTLLSVPYAAVFAAAVPLGLVAVSAVGGRIDSLSACAFGAAAGAAVLWAAPGVTGPRRRLQRLLLPVARRPRAIAAAVAGLGALTLLALVGAMTLTPTFSPLYGLQQWLEITLDRLQHGVNRF